MGKKEREARREARKNRREARKSKSKSTPSSSSSSNSASKLGFRKPKETVITKSFNKKSSSNNKQSINYAKINSKSRHGNSHTNNILTQNISKNNIKNKGFSQNAIAEKRARNLLLLRKREQNLKNLGFQKRTGKTGVEFERFKKNNITGKGLYNTQQFKNEENRINKFKEGILKKGGRTTTNFLKDGKTGNELEIKTTIVDRIDRGIVTREKIIETINKDTGAVEIKTYKYSKRHNRYILTGGLNYGNNSAKYLKEERQLKKILDNERKRLEAGVKAGKLTRDEAQKIYNAFKSARTIEFNNKFKDKKPAGIMSENKTKTINLKNIKSEFTKAKVNMTKYIKNADKDLDRLLAKNLIDRELIRSELNPIKQARQKEIENFNKTLNKNLLKAKTENEKKNLYFNANKTLKNIQIKYSKKGQDLANKLYLESGKGALLQALGFGRDIAKLGKKLTTDKEFRKAIKNGVSKLATDKEAREGAKQIIKEEWNNYVTLVKTSPEEAMILTGSSLLLGSLSGKIFKPVKKIALKSIKGTVKIGGKTLMKSKAIRKGVSLVGKNIRVLTKKGEGIIRVGTEKLKRVVPRKIRKTYKNMGKEIKRRNKVLKKGKLPSKEDYKINNLKVTKKEYLSYLKESKKYESQLVRDKLRTPLENIKPKSKSVTERISIKSLSKNELKQLSLLAKVNLGKIKQVDVTRVITKLKLKLPELKRKIIKQATKKKPSEGLWEFLRYKKDLYENTVSYGFIDKNGKYLFSATYSSLSNKSLNKFRNILNSFKYGTNKELTISVRAGKDYIKSYTKQVDKRVKPIIKRYISKFKGVKNNKLDLQTNNVKKTQIITKISRGTGSTKRQFKEGTEVSRKQLLEKTIKVKEIDKFKKGTIRIIREKEKTMGVSISKVEAVSEGLYPVKLRDALKNLKIKPNIKNKLKNELNLIKDSKAKIRIIKNNYKKNITKLKNKLLSSKNKKEIIKIKKQTDNEFYKLQNNLGNLEKKIIDTKRGLSQKLSRISAHSTPEIKIKTTKRKNTGINKLKKELENIRKFKKAVNKARIDKSISLLKASLLIAQAKVLENLLKKSNKTKQDMKKISDILTKQKKASLVQSKLAKDSLKVRPTIKIKEKVKPLIKPIIRIRPKNKPILRRRKKQQQETIKTLSKPTQLYKVYGKKRGRNVLLGKDLTKKDARDLLAYKVDNTLLRSAVIKTDKKSKKAKKINTKYIGAFNKAKKKLRQYKIKSKKKIHITGFIEKRKYIQDTKTEKKQLKRAKIKSKKKVVKRKKK